MAWVKGPMIMVSIVLAIAFQATPPSQKIYQARYLPQAHITVDGLLDEPAWRMANVERGFIFPWKKQAAPLTEFRALCDNDSLCFAFRIHDDDIVLAQEYHSKNDVVGEDRAELFFAADDKLHDYYCLEMDPRGRTLDYRGSHYRKFDFSWSMPGLRVAGRLQEKGYTVEGSIPLTSFEQLGFPPLRSGQKIRFGIFRAEFGHGTQGTVIEDWISWIDPRTENPDFHVPSSLGYLQVVK